MPHKDPAMKRAYMRTWARGRTRKRRAAGAQRDYFLRTRYGVTEVEWNELFEKQGRRCAICRSDEPKSKVGWHTDHDHATKKIRGILCENCNRGLGMYGDDITFLTRAARYLSAHQGVLTGDSIEQAGVFAPFAQRTKHHGLSYGKSYAGYDIRIDQDLTIPPKGFALGSSMEYFSMPNDCVGLVCDKSTHARRGLSMFNTVAEPGWRGYLTLELFNASDVSIELKAGDPIAQVLLLATDQPVERPPSARSIRRWR